MRSLGGWSEVKRLRLTDRDHIVSDERILRESDSVDPVLSQANEKYERHYELKCRGYYLNRLGEKVAEIYNMNAHDVFSKAREKQKVKTRSLLFFWAVREVGMSLSDLARRLG